MSIRTGFSPVQPYLPNRQSTLDMHHIGATLCHFPTGEATLLECHKHWITHELIPMMRKHPNAWIDLIGSASRAGLVTENMKLSHERINAVELFIRRSYPEIKINMRMPQGSSYAASFRLPENDNDGMFRSVTVLWYGLPKPVPVGVYLLEDPPKKLKSIRPKAPKGCWLIWSVDSFSLPIKGGVAGGTCDLTLLSDTGTKYKMKGVGGGAGVGVSIGPEHARKLQEFLQEIVSKAGDLQNISKTIKDMNLTGPNETNGGVMKRLTWAAKLTLGEITSSGMFTICCGDAHIIGAGGEMGFVFFGIPPIEAYSSSKYLTGASPWGFYTSLGLATMKASLGVSATLYMTTSVSQLPD